MRGVAQRRRRRAFLVVLAALGAVLVFVTGSLASSDRGAQTGADCSSVATSKPNWVSCMLDAMSVEERVGQMFVVDGFGETVDASDAQSVAANQTLYGPSISNIQDLIDAYHPGGIIYFTWSNTLTSPAQVVGLSNGIQQVALDQPTPVPILISIDQEQGEVLRIGSPATVFPGNMALGATRSTKLAYRNAAITGQELRAMGINVDNAPVVDVNTNPKNAADGIRAFGDRVPFVSKFATVAVKGYERSGEVSAVAKHWPGLGDTSTNPDTGISVSHQTLNQVKKVNFPPFEAAIRAGVDQIMVTHILMPKIEPDVPTSLSHLFVTDLLRKKLGYHGVVITDALNAQALSGYTPAEVAIMAIKAGDDQLLESDGFPNVEPANLVPAYQAVLDAVQSGEIPMSRIDRSVTRILRSKWKLGLAEDPLTPTGAVNKVVGTPDHLDVARQTARRSITVLQNRRGLLPLKAEPGTRALVAGWGQTSTPLIANELASRGLTTQTLTTGSTPSQKQIDQAQAAARKNDLVVVNTFNAWSSGNTQVQLVRALVATGTPVIVVAIGTPYDVAYFPRVAAFVSTYDYQQVSINAAVAALFGRYRPRGRLPVTVHRPHHPHPVLFPFGFGLGY